jgi:Mn-dependent DtxR family transcriptional regulator
MFDTKLYLETAKANLPNKVSKTREDVLRIAKQLIESNQPLYAYSIAKTLEKRPQALRHSIQQLIGEGVFTVERVKKIKLLVPTEKGCELLGLNVSEE